MPVLQRPTAPPEKPYPDFPLRAHARGKWTKKIGGKSYYFGSWADPFAALREYEAMLGTSDAPKEKRTSAAVMSIADAADLFLEAKASAVTEGTIVKRTFDDYLASCQKFVTRIGSHKLPNTLQPSDFASYRQWLVNEKKYGIVTVNNEIVRVKVFLSWVYATYFPGTTPLFGPSFARAGRKSMRRHKAEQKSKLIDPKTVIAILDESGVHFRAMVLLGINCGFGPTDCARLPLSVVQSALKTGWLKFPRAKTFVDRQAALWTETIAALSESLDRRPTPNADNKELFFVLPNGSSYDTIDGGSARLIHGRWRAAKKSARIEDGSFYCLRHTFNTIARQTGDAGAVKVVMGHADGTISETYDHDVDADHIIEPERLIRVSKKVRDWLGLGKRKAKKLVASQVD